MWDSSSTEPEGYHGNPMSKARCYFGPFWATISLGWNGGCYAALTNHRPHLLIQMTSPYANFVCQLLGVVDQGTAILAPFSQVVAVSFSCLLAACSLTAAVFSGSSALPPSFQTSCVYSSCPAVPWWSINLIGISHVSCAFRFYHRLLIVVLAENF